MANAILGFLAQKLPVSRLYKLRQHVPSDKVIEFVNLDQKEDSIRTAGRIKLPTYNPFGAKKK